MPPQSATFQGLRIHLGYTVTPGSTPLEFNDINSDSETGHLWWWQSEDGGMVEKRLLEEYGAVVRWSGTLGVRFSPLWWTQTNPGANTIIQEQRLWIADAKAVHHILHAAGYLYEIPSVRREMLVAVLGGGLVVVEGVSLHSHLLQSNSQIRA